MATHDYVIANGTGAAVRSDLNNALAAIVSNNSSSSAPSTPYAYQWWADTNTNTLKIRNSANNGWITLRELDGTMLIEDGTAAAPGLSFADDTSTGIFRSSTNKINFATNGVERLELANTTTRFNEGQNDINFRVSTSGNANMLFVDGGEDRVGIGTSSCEEALSVDGHLHIRNTTESYIYLTNTTSANRRSYIAALEQTGNSNDLVFATNANGEDGTEKMRLDVSGRLLVGTSSSLYTNAFLQVAGPNSNTYISMTNTTAGDANGSGYNYIHFRRRQSGGEESSSARIGSAHDGTADDEKGRLMFFTNDGNDANSPTERMRITSDGDIYFHTTSGTIDTSNHGMVFHDSDRLDVGRNVSATGSVFQAFGGNGQFRIMGDGDAENTNNRYTGISDIKYKQNVQNASSQWDDIKGIQVRKYELIANPGVKHIGVVAQELEQICPGLVIERTVDEETGETAKSVAYSVLYMKAVKALQEAMDRIETLEAKVAALEAG